MEASRIEPGCREDRVDHLWTQILRFYFPLSGNFGIEREPYTSETSRGKVDIVVTGLIDDKIYKLLFFEAKRPSHTMRSRLVTKAWSGAESELQKNIHKWRERRSSIPVAGITAIGDKLRTYVIPEGQSNLEAFDGDEPLSLNSDADRVHERLSNIRNRIKSYME
ncbi:hypothetical protein N7462_005824 [Penicillium macrosclerotiorum]|uniref:uncharacterized protein n=1 Tax=Penicillium macrosclerotiorum TaxID=303699 RepID=UPI002547ECA9|nr:uncharacterized protein N7462_005824 [Penicillium macrosclerotiorum]KAJ5682659.1 hypothetical protein N7462_005824 [Penicillium macrosclerotiorum]